MRLARPRPPSATTIVHAKRQLATRTAPQTSLVGQLTLRPLPFPVSTEATMPAPLPAAADHADRDRFRSAVTALPPGPLRDVLTAVAYARDAAARTGTGAAPHDR
jgi:hypothetical protein